MRWTTRFILTLATITPIAMGITGCGSNKSATKTRGHETTPTQSGLSVTASECKAILTTYGDWERVKMPLNLRLRQPKSVSMSAQATMERGKSITISLRFIGMEVGVIYVTSDSLIAIDKFNRQYVSEALRPLLGGFPANISNVQDLLLGRPFLLGNEKPLTDVSDKFDIEPMEDGSGWSLVPKTFPKSVEYGFSFTPITTLSLMIIKAGSHEPVNVKFIKPVTTPSGPMSPSISIAAMLGKTMVDASLEWNFSKAKWNEGIEVKKPTIPRNADRISATKLLKAVSSL